MRSLSRYGWLGLVIVAVGCASARIRTPTQGPITVSGTCAAESAGAQDAYETDLAQSGDLFHQSLEISIDHGMFTFARFETGSLDLSKDHRRLPAEIVKPYRGDVHPNVPLTVGEWVSIAVPLARIDDGAPKEPAQVKVRVLGSEMEFLVGDSPIKGPCSWGATDRGAADP